MTTSSSSSSLLSLREDIKRLERLFLKKSPVQLASLSSTSCTSNVSCSSNFSKYECSSTNALQSQPSTSYSSPHNFLCFRLVSANKDELVCELIDSNKKKYRINANICVCDVNK